MRTMRTMRRSSGGLPPAVIAVEGLPWLQEMVSDLGYCVHDAHSAFEVQGLVRVLDARLVIVEASMMFPGVSSVLRCRKEQDEWLSSVLLLTEDFGRIADRVEDIHSFGFDRTVVGVPSPQRMADVLQEIIGDPVAQLEGA
jgi:hypothetical protein